MKYSRWVLLGANIFLVIIGSLIFSGNLTIVTLVNNLFYISFIYLIIWLFLLTIRGGFYDGITYGFRRFHYIMSRNKDYLVEWKKKALPSENLHMTLYQHVKFQAYFLLFIFLTVLGLYYFV